MKLILKQDILYYKIKVNGLFFENNIKNINDISKLRSFIQQYGQYEQCLQLGSTFNYNFLTINLTKNLLIPIVHMGLCLPKECQPPLIKSTTDNILYNMNLSATVTNVNNTVQQFHYEYDWIFYFAIIFMCSLLIIMIYSTIIKYRQKQTVLSFFSFQESSKYFQRNPKSNLNVFNGIKSIAMFLVIYIHIMKNTKGINSINLLEKGRYYRQVYYLIAYKGQGAVAIFLYVSGFLVAYVVIKQLREDNWVCLVNIIHRYLRFLPSLLVIMMLYFAFYLHLGSGQLWDNEKTEFQKCQKILPSIFFISNFFGCICYPSSWYLNVDMQLYSFSMLILLLYKYKPTISKIFTCLLILISIIQLLFYSQSVGFAIPIRLQDLERSMRTWTFQYLKPWKWMGAYFLGLYFGILYYQYLQQTKIKKIKKQPAQTKIQTPADNISIEGIQRMCILSKLEFTFKTNKTARICCQNFGLFLILFYIFIPRTLQLNVQWSQTTHSIYQSTQYFGLSLGVNLLILPSILGCKNSLVTFVLDTCIFNFISKISFITYLIHINFVRAHQFGLTSTYYFQFIPKFVDFVSLSIISMFFAFWLTILVQVPFSNLHKLLLAKLKSQKKQQIKQKQKQKQRQRQIKERNEKPQLQVQVSRLVLNQKISKQNIIMNEERTYLQSSQELLNLKQAKTKTNA